MRVAELITYAELHAGCHMGTGPMRSRPICESERLMVWLPLSRGYVAPWRGQRNQWNFPNVHREPLEFLRRIMIAGEEPCVLSAPKGKPRRGCATAGFPAPGPTGDRNYWGPPGQRSGASRVPGRALRNARFCGLGSYKDSSRGFRGRALETRSPAGFLRPAASKRSASNWNWKRRKGLPIH